MQARGGTNGIEELRDAVLAIGLTVEEPAGATGMDLFLVNPAGGRISVQLKRISLASAEGLEHRLSRWVSPDGNPDLRVVVADRITEQARRVLRAAGWGWLDLRGHLHLVGKGLYVDVDVPRLSTPPDRSLPLAGRVAEEVAALMLLHPTDPASIRQIARALGRSPSSVSSAITGLRSAGLVDERRKPVVPDLFWQLAERWQPQLTDLQRAPSTASGAGSVQAVLRLGMTNIEATTGWALTDTVAAAAYGAPVGIRSDYPPDFYVPDQAIVRRAVNLLGMAHTRESRAATVRIAPIPLICASRIDRPHETWPLARPLFVALDLASDPGRGREILEGWTPPHETGPRVW
ncbi:MarR family transcriptional regulator [Micromonospora cathayae]|uniref:MarR family transcriptional regulator n=1 Tax=Micromonospora cathayae TaxID=3028804 RepID=A0ABY7ZUQ6_9ACTN|nr:MarR family transcriptional regulator [Micromonospora sp. HUAS 3]WDZ86695.1 MarR family transcriptional regulator [Micromonospora sp. HUAS 3]